MVGLEHLDEQLHHVRGRVELAAAVAFGAGELLDEVLVDPTEDITRFVGVRAEADLRDRRDQLAESLRGDRRPGVHLRQHILQRRILPLDQLKRLVQLHPDVRLRPARKQRIPTGLLGHPERVCDLVGVAVFEHLRPLLIVLHVPVASRVTRQRVDDRTPRVEPIRDVLEEHQAQDEMLVLRGLHASA